MRIYRVVGMAPEARVCHGEVGGVNRIWPAGSVLNYRAATGVNTIAVCCKKSCILEAASEGSST